MANEHPTMCSTLPQDCHLSSHDTDATILRLRRSRGGGLREYSKAEPELFFIVFFDSAAMVLA